MRGALPWALLVATALSGCSSGDGGGGTFDPVEPGEVLVEGVVVDVAIRPVAGATVSALGGGATATTDADGEFSFALPAGSIVLEATHPAFAPVQQTFEFREGEPVRAVLQFAFTASQAPYSILAKYDGFIVCSLGASVIFSEECGEGVGTPAGRVGKQGNNAIRYDFTAENPSLMTAVVEQVWEPTSDAGRDLSLVFATAWTCEPACGGEAVGAGSVKGPSPLLLRADAEDLAPHLEDPATVFTTYTLALTDPVAANVVLNQPFQLFVTLFYREPAPEGYSFIAGS